MTRQAIQVYAVLIEGAQTLAVASVEHSVGWAGVTGSPVGTGSAGVVARLAKLAIPIVVVTGEAAALS